MQVPRLARFLALLVFAVVVVANAQSPTKDTTALAVLTQMAAATGWSQLTLPVDAVAAGTVTRFRGNTSETLSVRLKARGFRQYRAEVGGFSGTTTIRNGDRAALQSAEGTKWLPAHSAQSTRAFVFPFFSELTAIANEDVAVRYVGLEDVGNEKAHRVEIFREPGPDQPSPTFIRRRTRITVWVSATTALPLQIEYSRPADDNPSALLTRVRRFSDWRAVNGLALPFRQEELINGKVVYSLQLSQAQFNVGLTDSDFTLPSAPAEIEE